MPIFELAARDVELRETDARYIRHCADELTATHGGVTACRVLVEAPHRRRRHGHTFRVHIALTTEQGDHLVALQAEPELRAAVRGAFAAAESRLEVRSEPVEPPTPQ